MAGFYSQRHWKQQPSSRMVRSRPTPRSPTPTMPIRAVPKSLSGNLPKTTRAAPVRPANATPGDRVSNCRPTNQNAVISLKRPVSGTLTEYLCRGASDKAAGSFSGGYAAGQAADRWNRQAVYAGRSVRPVWLPCWHGGSGRPWRPFSPTMVGSSRRPTTARPTPPAAWRPLPFGPLSAEWTAAS